MNLHNHSMFSYKDGYGTPAQIAARLVELRQSAFAITDHGNVSGWAPLYPVFKDAGIKLLFGIEAYIVEDRHQKGAAVTAIQYASRKFNLTEQRSSVNSNTGKVTTRIYDPIPHITIIATSQEGISNIRNLVAESYKTGLFSGRPRIDLELLFKYQKGCLITTGCPTGFPTRLITRKEAAKSRTFIELLKKNIDNLVVEIVAQPGYTPSELAASHLYETASDSDLKVIITGDSHFPSPEDYFSEHMLARIGTGNKMDEVASINIPDYQFISSRATLLDRANRMLPGYEAHHSIALDNAQNICDDIPALEIKSGTPPIYAIKTNTPNDIMWKDAGLGLKKRFEDGYLPIEKKAEYIARLKHELDVIFKKDLSSYFLIMRDIVLKQKNAGRVVVCRGSAGGSLVCYALGISETDPIKFGLYFERFLDENRDDYADVDVDFSPDGRDEAFEDISDLGYKACRIEAHSMFTLKSAILAVARMYKISRTKLDSALGTISDSTVEEPDSIKQLFNDIPELQVARKLVGQAYTSSIHAAGVIISNEDTSFPIYYKKDNHSGKMVPTICLNKKQVEKNGYLKADLLSVRALSVIENVLRKVGLSPEVLYKLDLNDPKVFEVCNKYPAGLFQLDGSIWSVYKQISGKNFDDIVSANALGRPGAFNFIPLYAKRLRHGLNRIDKVLDDTYGVCLFQEQIMAICRLFGMSWVDTHAMRRAISSSSTGKADSIEKVKFYLAKLKELAGNEISEEQYDNIEKHGKYSFNKSHCVTYALVCYWMAWIKTYYPEEFVEEYCNMEAKGSNTDWILVRRLIFELTKRGVCKKIVPLDVEQRVPFVVKNGVFTGSFLSIHGAGEKGGLSTVDALQNMGVKKLSAAKLKSIQTIARAFSTQTTAQSVSLHWIPWLPVIEGEHYNKCISSWAGDVGYDGMEALANECIYSPRSLVVSEVSARQTVCVAGYATSVKRKAQTLAMPYAILNLLVENPNGQILCQVSAKNEEAYYRCVSDIKRGDFIAIQGTYDGRLFRAWEVEVFRSDSFESTKTLIEENSEEEV